MLQLSFGLFIIAAILGLTVAVALFRRQPTSKPVAVVHGLFAATGLVLLIIAAVKVPDRLLTIAIVLLVIAALGGLLPFVNDTRGKPGPLGLVPVHAIAAVIAVVLVAIVAFA